MKSPLIKYILFTSSFLLSTACTGHYSATPINAASNSITSPSPAPAPSPAPSPNPSPSPSAFPNASNTGVPTGTSLVVHNGDLTVNTANAVIDGLDIRGNLIINATGVTVKSTKVTAANWFVILAQPDTVIQDCTVDGIGTGNDGSNGINGGGKFLRNNIYNVENGIVASDGSLVQDNYVHDLKASGSPHYDGIQQLEGSNITIVHNTIDMGNLGETGAVNLTSWSGPINNILIENNLLKGGSYTIYADNTQGKPMSNVTVRQNRMLSGTYGYFAFYTTPVTQCGNVIDQSGQALDNACP